MKIPEALLPLNKWIKYLNFFYKKSLGQHFIFDLNITRKIVSFADIQENDWVFEIGPGIGSLTLPILEKDPLKLTVIDFDKNITNLLENEYKKFFPNLEIIYGDALQNNFFGNIFISNLPYNISVPLLIKAIQSGFYKKIICMVQKEVGERIIGKKGNYGKISVLFNIFSFSKIVMDVNKKSFYPAPKVESVVLEIIPKNKENLFLFEEFSNFLKIAFSQKRKKISKTINIKSDKRPDEIDPEEFWNIFKNLRK